MVRILLIDLGTPRDEISEALGVETLAAHAIKEFSDEVKVDVRSVEIDNLKSISQYLLQSETYDIIGISTKIRSFGRFQEAMESIGLLSPDSVVLVGDILGTYAFEEVLDLYPGVICVRGEGETALKEIIRAKLRSENGGIRLDGIKNLAYRKNGSVVTSRGEPEDLSLAINPNRSLAGEVLKQNGIGRLEGSRGCSYSLCEFCGTVEKYCKPGWRPFPIEFIISELETLSALGFRSPYFTDEDFFGSDHMRLYELAHEIEVAKTEGRIGPDLDFYFNMRANSVLGIGIGGKQESVKLLKRLKSVGLREVFIGVESGSKEQLLKRYKKGTTQQSNIDAIQTLYGLGLEADLGFIYFDKDSTLEECRENINFFKAAGILKHDSQMIKRVRIEPRTPLGEKFNQANPDVKVNLNLVEFPYKFKHQAVADIFYAFEKWQADDLDVIYNLQSMCRGEVPKGFSRHEIKSIVGAYRELDIQFVDHLLRAYEEKPINIGAETKSTIRRFQDLRSRLDKTHIDRMKWLDSNFRRFGV